MRRDTRTGRITLTVDLSVFDKVAPLSGSLTTVRAIAWTGEGDPLGGTYGSDDVGRTKRTYRLGAPACT